MTLNPRCFAISEIGAMSTGIAGWLISEKARQLGTLTMRNSQMKYIVNPRAITYDGPIAILVDELTASTAEIFSGGMKDLGRATIVGSPTAGAALPATMTKLPNGDGFLYAIANYVSEGGEELEGIGVIPHIEATSTREQLLAGRDIVIEKAVDAIKEQKVLAVEAPYASD